MRILIVEDHVDSATVLARVLINLGHEPIVAHDCATALATAEKTHPDAALCDLGLPDGDGIELMVALRDQYRVRSAAVTGHGESQYRLECEGAGFPMVVKPFQIDQLRNAITCLSNAE
jgi:DNA-binding response OmpR family regulator